MARAKRKEKPRSFSLPGLTSRPAWQGSLRLSLVTCAVGLYRATTVQNDVSFNLINPDTGNRVKMVPTDAESGEQVERSTLVKGFEVDEGKYVLFDDDELKAVKLETTRTLDIERFVDAKTIDRLYLETPYILVPMDENAVEAYSVIQQAMARAGKVALGRVTMHTRERLMAIEPRDNGLLATTLRMRDEVINTAEALGEIPHAKADKQMIDIAERIIAQQEGAFDPEEFTDRYEEALHALIEEKRRGHKVKTVREAPAKGNVVDLMDALKKSLGKKPAKAAKEPAQKAEPTNVRKFEKKKTAKR